MIGVAEHLVANLGVGDGAVLLPEVKTQLTLVPEVQVTLLTLEGGKEAESRRLGR